MMAATSIKVLLTALLLPLSAFAAGDACVCDGSLTRTVTHIVIEMPTTTPSAESLAPPPLVERPQVEQKLPTEHRFGPVPLPDIDSSSPKNLVPAKEVSLFYASSEEDTPGSINMTLALNNPAVVLEHVDAIRSVECDDDMLTVTFQDLAAFSEALDDWTPDIDEGFFLITNHLGNCDAEFERGFFLATSLESDENSLSIKVNALKEDLAQIAGSCEMTFNSLPAATLTKRIELNPSTSLTFGKGLDPGTVLFSDGKYISVVADEAFFTTTIGFSGYFKYDFWAFSVRDLYFDLDTTFDSAVGLSAAAQAAYSNSFRYAPDELSYSLVSVPGLVSLGPGLAFAVGVDIDVSAAVGVKAGVEVTIPNGNVHVDFLDSKKTSASGWEPQYNTYANITEKADVHIDAGAELTVELAFKLLGGLVDLSSGITAVPGFDNTFRLRGEQNVGIGGTGNQTKPVVDIPSEGVCAEDNSVALKTDFYFNLTAFATQWWNAELYSVRLPLWDTCYNFVESEA